MARGKKKNKRAFYALWKENNITWVKLQVSDLSVLALRQLWRNKIPQWYRPFLQWRLLTTTTVESYESSHPNWQRLVDSYRRLSRLRVKLRGSFRNRPEIFSFMLILWMVWSHDISRWNMIVRVSVVLIRTVFDSEWSFNSLTVRLINSLFHLSLKLTYTIDRQRAMLYILHRKGKSLNGSSLYQALSLSGWAKRKKRVRIGEGAIRIVHSSFFWSSLFLPLFRITEKVCETKPWCISKNYIKICSIFLSPSPPPPFPASLALTPTPRAVVSTLPIPSGR